MASRCLKTEYNVIEQQYFRESATYCLFTMLLSLADDYAAARRHADDSMPPIPWVMRSGIILKEKILSENGVIGACCKTRYTISPICQ